jgi:hypothetical protein
MSEHLKRRKREWLWWEKEEEEKEEEEEEKAEEEEGTEGVETGKKIHVSQIADSRETKS